MRLPRPALPMRSPVPWRSPTVHSRPTRRQDASVRRGGRGSSRSPRRCSQRI